MTTAATPPARIADCVRRHWFVLLLLCATALGAGLRLYKLEAGSFWLDELYTVRTTHHLAEGRGQWIKVAGYIPSYLGFSLAGVDPSELDAADPSGWRAAGVTELNARLPIAILGILSVPLLALASRRMLGDRGAIMLAFLLAASPWHVYWSQAARFYTLQFLFYNLSLALYFSATRPLSRERLVLALTMGVLAFMSQPTALVLAVVFAADWLLAALRRDAAGPVRLGAFGWAAAIGAAVCCVLLYVADAMTGRDGLAHAVSDPLHQSPQGVVLAAAYLIWPSVAAFAACAAVWLWRTTDPRLAVYLGIAAVFPIAFYAALAAVYPVGSRYAFICAFAWIALAAAGADKAWGLIRPRAGVALAAAPLAALLTGCLLANALSYNSHGNLHARWREAVATADRLRAPGEPVYASTPYIASYYLGEPARALPTSHDELAAIPHTAWFVVDMQDRATSSRFWLLPDAALVDYFSLRAAHTNSSVQVYRHTPQGHPGLGAGAAGGTGEVAPR